jgi:hypothetical protein
MFGGAVQTLQERMVELLKENLSQIRSELFPYADDRLNILISYIQDEFEEGQPFEDKQALAHMLNKTYKHIKKELNHYPLPPTKWAKKYNDDDEFKKIVDSTLDQLKELLDELEPEANVDVNAMPLDGGRRRKTRSRKSRNTQRRMFGGAEISLQEKWLNCYGLFQKFVSNYSHMPMNVLIS